MMMMMIVLMVSKQISIVMSWEEPKNKSLNLFHEPFNRSFQKNESFSLPKWKWKRSIIFFWKKVIKIGK